MADKKDEIKFFDKSDNLSPHEKELVDCVICVPLTLLPAPVTPAHMEHCSICEAEVWVAETSPKIPRRICISCIPIAVEQTKAAEKARLQ